MPSDAPHTADHFAIGDIAQWSGIKRCGAAMHMGYLAAHNIHQLMQQRLKNVEPDFVELEEVPPMIGLAVGKKAVAYWPEAGMTSGEDVLKTFFGDDLGFSSKSPIFPGPLYSVCDLGMKSLTFAQFAGTG
jgi:hypothetical protein